MKSTLEIMLLGCVISEAADGHQALEMLAENPVDIVVLDLHLAEMHGFVVLEKIVA
jgi:CheY-like chemotaxis protein